jgi:hypothetical protein
MKAPCASSWGAEVWEQVILFPLLAVLRLLMILPPPIPPFLAPGVPSPDQEVRSIYRTDFETWRQEPVGTWARNSTMVNPAALPAHPLSERSFLSLLFLIISVLPWGIAGNGTGSLATGTFLLGSYSCTSLRWRSLLYLFHSMMKTAERRNL